MKKVQQKSATSKKVVRDRRILAKARREDGISPAPHRGAQGKQPVSGGIRRAAERAGLRPTPDSLRVAFQIGTFVRDAEWAIIRSSVERDPSRLLQALASLQDVDKWLEELWRLLPKRSKRSALLASGGAS